MSTNIYEEKRRALSIRETARTCGTQPRNSVQTTQRWKALDDQSSAPDGLSPSPRSTPF